MSFEPIPVMEMVNGKQVGGGTLDNTNLSDAYSASKTYAVGDYCIHDNRLMVCKTAISTPEPWNSAKWEGKKVGEALSEVTSDLSELPYAIKVTPIVDVTSDSVGRVVIKNNFTLPNGAIPILIVAVNGVSTLRFTTPMLYQGTIFYSAMVNDLTGDPAPNNHLGGYCVYIVPRS